MSYLYSYSSSHSRLGEFPVPSLALPRPKTAMPVPSPDGKLGGEGATTLKNNLDSSGSFSSLYRASCQGYGEDLNGNLNGGKGIFRMTQ